MRENSDEIPSTSATEGDDQNIEEGQVFQSMPDQVDREDDDEMENENEQILLKKKMQEEEEKKGTYEYDVRQSLNGPINLADLRISMPIRTNELEDSLLFFEQLLKESYGEMRFRRAMQVIEEFKGVSLYFTIRA